ncbi:MULTISPECIES: flagellar filament capping protein FliD [unclassified Sphingomonas]|uniref:flagellar filament capping protein FliD n=1 Tax=unclassified Sphingomonas TaxID=196159 RepID=UPI00226A4C33|nr:MULTISPECIES: flagellar filament capping protein FliD [unclassified Sphingomonas]
MTTTTSTSSTTTSTTAASSIASITSTLGVGSGIDTASLVTSLVAAQYAAKNTLLANQADTLTSQISGIASVKSSVTGFSSAFNSLVTGGTLTTQPSSSNTGVLTATAQSGAKLAGLSASILVKQLASAQAATMNTAIPSTTAFNTGTFSLQFGSDSTDANGNTSFTAGSSNPVSITIGSGDATLAGIAAKINAAGANVTATVIADGNGQRLSIKGATGQSQAFTLTGTDDASSTGGTSLSTLNVGRNATGTTIGTGAQDAVVTLDGATFQRSSNTINNLITGVRLSLTGTSTTPVTIGTTPPTSALSQAVNDIVTTFNQVMGVLQTQTDPVNGVLKSETTVTGLARSLGVLTTTKLATPSTTGGPSTLAEIGVKTNKDGTLSVDSTQLATALANYPADVEALFALGTGTASTGNGLYAALNAITTTATNNTYGLDAATARYTAQQTTVTGEQADQTTAAADTKTRLTQQFSAMDAKVAAYKSTQSFLTQQIAAWDKSS